MKVEGITLVITDPCYIKKSPGVTKYFDRSTIYGDWSCMCYKGDKEEAKKKSKEWDNYYFNFFNTYNFGDLNKEEKKALIELICNEQTHMIIKDHTKYDSDKYKKLEELKANLVLFSLAQSIHDWKYSTVTSSRSTTLPLKSP